METKKVTARNSAQGTTRNTDQGTTRNTAQGTALDKKDRELLRIIQESFPLEPEPYRVLGDKLFIDEVSVISRLARMMQEDIVRYIGPFFNSRKLGYIGLLAAMNVAEPDIGRAAAILDEYPQVTHNYLRDGSPNIWFTVLAKGEAERDRIIAEIREKAGVTEIKTFPSRRLFKVKVSLK